MVGFGLCHNLTFCCIVNCFVPTLVIITEVYISTAASLKVYAWQFLTVKVPQHLVNVLNIALSSSAALKMTMVTAVDNDNVGSGEGGSDGWEQRQSHDKGEGEGMC